MHRVIMFNSDADPLALRDRAHHEGVTLAPGSHWTHRILVVDVPHSDPLDWPGVSDLGPTAFAGLPAGSPAVPPRRQPVTVNPGAFAAAASQERAVTWTGDAYVSRSSGRRLTGQPARVVDQRVRSRAVVIERRTAATAAWLADVAHNPVVSGTVLRVARDGAALLRCSPGQLVVLPRPEQVHPVGPGERRAVRLVTSGGGRATERDAGILQGLARRVLQATYIAPVRDVWPTGDGSPRLALVLVPSHAYAAWVAAALALRALSGRTGRVVPASCSRTAMVRRALCCRWPVREQEDACAVLVPSTQLPHWQRCYDPLLPLVQQLVDTPVRVVAV